MPRKRQIMRNPNNYGTIKKLSGNRRRPYMVGVNPKINDKGTYTYEILGYFEDRTEAMIALAEYNKNPVDLTNKDITFEEVYNLWFEDKFVKSKKQLSKSSVTVARAAFKNASALHRKRFADIRHADLQDVIDSSPLRHASLEHILTMYKGMYAFAMREDIVQRNHSEFVTINIPDDDEHGIRMDNADVALLWANTDVPFVKVVLIYLYTGWRATELSEMQKGDIDIEEMLMKGGKKTQAGKNRIVPIHPRIQGFVTELYEATDKYLFPSRQSYLSYNTMAKMFAKALSDCGIETKYTLHDCRHTFDSWLHDAGVPDVVRNLLMGHAGKDLDEKVYIHKTIEQLREAVESLS